MVDATTFDTCYDLGCRRSCRTRVHLAGVTVAKSEAEAAKTWVEAWIGEHTTVTPPALLLSRVGSRRSCLLMAPDGALLNRDLIRSGFASLCSLD